MQNNIVEKKSADGNIADCEEEDDMWDDSLIIKSYDESLQLVKEEVAKKIAMLTNTRLGKTKRAENTEEKTKDKALAVGDYVRATYEDGVDYEARIMSMDKEGKCLIKYIGYENEQTAVLDELIPSWGRAARRKQRQDAEESVANNSNSKMDCSDEILPKLKNRFRINLDPGFMPGNTSFMIPPPPPMPPMLDDDDDAESENLSAMLMSWYMSGYYTGLYHGQKMSQKRQKSS